LDVDAYHIGFDNTYTSTLNTDLLPVYYSGGTSTTKGVEAESTVILGAGLSLYLNGTVGSAKYDSTHFWLANAPGNTETAGLSYQQRNWDIGFFNKRIGKMWNDNGANNQAIPIDPFEISNVYFNYT
jgi:iron complex outermembrane receptor protein